MIGLDSPENYIDAIIYVHYSRHMDTNIAITMFDALAQETRIKVFRLLVKAGGRGMPAGAISEALGTPHNTMSFHLNQLMHAGLIKKRKQGRSVIYRADYEATAGLIGFLVKDCCSGDFASIKENNKTGKSVIQLSVFCDTDE